MRLALWYNVFVCHQYDICKNSVGRVNVGRYGVLSESGLYVIRELCFLWSVVMPHVNCGYDG